MNFGCLFYVITGSSWLLCGEFDFKFNDEVKLDSLC
jgi:hypothetical protein